jgi:hypothetical protein
MSESASLSEGLQNPEAFTDAPIPAVTLPDEPAQKGDPLEERFARGHTSRSAS